MARNVEVARLFYRLEADAKGLEQELGKSERSLDRLTKFIVANPVAALAGIGAAAVAAGLKLSAMAAEFEQQMKRVNTVAQLSEGELRNLSAGVLDLFASLPIDSLNDLTDGLYDIVSAGIPAGQSLDVLRVAAESAVGGTTDVSTSVKGLVLALNVFKDDGLTAADAADTLFVGVNKGITTFDKLADSVGVVAPLAQNLGVSFQDLTAAEAALTTKGFETSVAATSLRAIFSNLLKPTSQLVQEYPKLATAFDATALKTKGLGGFLNDLAPVLIENQDAAVKMFGSVEALNAILALTGDGGAKFNEILDAMAQRSGAAQAAFETMNNTTENQAKILKNQLNAQLIELGETILPTVNSGLHALNAIVALLFGGNQRTLAKALTKEIGSIVDNLNFLPKGGEAAKQAFDDLGKAMREVADGPGGLLRDTFQSIARADFSKLANDQLVTLTAGLSAAANSGQASAYQMTQIEEALADIKREADKRGLKLIAEDAGEAGDSVGTTTDQIHRLTDAQIAAVKASSKLTDEQKAAVLASGQITAATKEFVDTALKEQTEKSKEAAKKLRELREELAETFAQETTTLIDDTALAIKAFKDRAKEVKLPRSEVDAFVRSLEQQGHVLESVRLSTIATYDALSSPEPELALRTAEESLETIQGIMEALEPNTKAYNDALAESERLSKLIRDIQERIKKIGTDRIAQQQILRDAEDDQLAAELEFIRTLKLTEAEKVQILVETRGITAEQAKQLLQGGERNSQLQTSIEKIASVAQGVLGLATAFGIVDDQAAAVLQNVIAIGTNIGKALGGDPTAIIGVIGSLTGVLGSIFGGESPEEKARREIVLKNTAAIEANTKRIGSLLEDTTGAQFAGVQAALEAAFGAIQGRGPLAAIEFLPTLRKALFEAGLTFGDLESVAKDAGIEIKDPSGGFSPTGLRQLLAFINSDEFTSFGDTFAEQIDRIRVGLEAGIIDPLDEFSERARLGTERSPALAAALSGVDFNAPGGRDAAVEALQDLLRNIENLTAGELGGLTRQQFIGEILALLELLRSDRQFNFGPVRPDTGQLPEGARESRASDQQIAEILGFLKTRGDVTDELVTAVTAALPGVSGSQASAFFDQLKAAAASGSLTEDEAAALRDTIDAELADLERAIAEGTITEEDAIATRRELAQRLKMVEAGLAGTISPEEAADLIAAIESMAEEARKGLSEPTVPGVQFSVADMDRSLADVLGEASPIADLLEQIVENTAAFKPVAPPSLAALVGPGSLSAAAGAHVDLSGSTFQFHFGGDGALTREDAAQAGRDAAAAFLDRLEQEQARRLDRQLRLLGDAGVP